MKLKCIRDVVMDSGETAFIQGKNYDLNNSGTFYMAINEQGDRHYFDDYGQDDWVNWFDEVAK